MRQHIAVVVPRAGGGWNAYIPDFPECHGEGVSMDAAIKASCVAASTMASELQARGLGLPKPLSYEEVRHGREWADKPNIDWSAAIVSLVTLTVRT